jgi:1-acyl-sn-glycerol-3-phosphate acyltransferase
VTVTPAGGASPAPSPPAPSRSRGAVVWYAFARAVVELVSRIVWRVEVHGREHVPRLGPFVLAPVHRSNLDTLIAGCVVRRRMRFMGKDSLWNHASVGRLFTSLGAFPVHRGVPDRESMRVCEAALRAGEPIVLFPEGTRQSGPVVQPILDGAVFVAARTGVPIVPVGIGGSEWALPKGSKGIRPVKVVAVVGAPIRPPARSATGRVPRQAVSDLSQQLHTELQARFDEALRLAGRA